MGIEQHIDSQVITKFTIPVKSIFDKSVNLRVLQDFFDSEK
ncbi:MAG: hypothetical protein ACJAYJ_003844 [Saprospiraceae bacterium]